MSEKVKSDKKLYIGSRIPESCRQALDFLAQLRKTTVSDIIGDIIEKYLVDSIKLISIEYKPETDPDDINGEIITVKRYIMNENKRHELKEAAENLDKKIKL